MARQAKVLSQTVLCKQPGRYIGWPTIARAANGDVLVVFSGDRDAHVCMAGKTQMVRSTDGGATWGEAFTINDTPMDDRDAGIVALPDGTLVISWFASFHHPDAHPGRQDLDKWWPYIERITEQDKEKWLGGRVSDKPETWLSGYWTRRSLDNGFTWEEPVKVRTSAPHGPVALSDGSLLYVGTNSHYNPDNKRVIVQKSLDKGLSWNVEAEWSAYVDQVGESRGDLVEPHSVETASGRVVAMFRYERRPHTTPAHLRGYSVLWQAESEDGGATWNSPRPTEIWGKPPHLIKLRDGRILLTYGHRREPYGERACFSHDGGETWDYANELVLTEALDGDLGYPASLEMEDGDILTVYYEKDRPGEKTCLQATKWRPE